LARRATPLNVVFICTGNRFRSPLAAALLQRETGDVTVEVHSHGTVDVGTAPPLPEAQMAAERAGVDLDAHRASVLPRGGLADADLVIGFERAHIVAAVVEGAASRERCFTLPELVHLLEQTHVPGLEPRLAISRAAAVRTPALVSTLEIADPLGKTKREQQEVAAEIERLTRQLAGLLLR
jgi:protein-tyrosine phosphatase